MWEYSICFTIGNHKHLILPLTFLSFCLPSSFPPSFLSFFLFYLREGKLFFCLYMKLTFILLYSSFENNNCSHICWKYNISLTKSLKERKKVLVTQSCLTLCDPMVYSLPGSSVHGILPAGILEQVAIPYSRGSSQSRDQTRSPSLQADSLLSEPSEKPHLRVIVVNINFLSS